MTTNTEYDLYIELVSDEGDALYYCRPKRNRKALALPQGYSFSRTWKIKDGEELVLHYDKLKLPPMSRNKLLLMMLNAEVIK